VSCTSCTQTSTHVTLPWRTGRTLVRYYTPALFSPFCVRVRSDQSIAFTYTTHTHTHRSLTRKHAPRKRFRSRTLLLLQPHCAWCPFIASACWPRADFAGEWRATPLACDRLCACAGAAFQPSTACQSVRLSARGSCWQWVMLVGAQSSWRWCLCYRWSSCACVGAHCRWWWRFRVACEERQGGVGHVPPCGGVCAFVRQ
jgi:hypothetical protein